MVGVASLYAMLFLHFCYTSQGHLPRDSSALPPSVNGSCPLAADVSCACLDPRQQGYGQPAQATTIPIGANRVLWKRTWGSPHRVRTVLSRGLFHICPWVHLLFQPLTMLSPETGQGTEEKNMLGVGDGGDVAKGTLGSSRAPVREGKESDMGMLEVGQEEEVSPAAMLLRWL